MRELIERLGFWIDRSGATAVLREVGGGCHPATRSELALWDALEAAREDAEDAARWRFCVERDVMPVIADDGKTWCMFVSVSSRRRSLFTGKTPAEAVDAAIDQARGKEESHEQ